MLDGKTDFPIWKTPKKSPHLKIKKGTDTEENDSHLVFIYVVLGIKMLFLYHLQL